MTTVNWERESGERVEEFVAALLLLRHPHGNLITPSRGDRGVDVRIRVPGRDGYDIYQVKRFSSALTSAQAKNVEKSWTTFKAEVLGMMPVHSWNLVLPWNPTFNRLEWLARLTDGSGIRIEWLGRTNLDVMTADNPALVDYYFGDGGERLHGLLTQVFGGAQPLPEGLSGAALVSAITEKYASLAGMLDTVDPFYRYEIDVITGSMERDSPWDNLRAHASHFTSYQQVSPEIYIVRRVIPLSSASWQLRPISGNLQFEAARGSEEYGALERFFDYGAPFEHIPAIMVDAAGPPGTVRNGPGFYSFLSDSSMIELPDLEVRLVSEDGEVLDALDLVEPRAATGLRGGSWLSVRDRSGMVEFELLSGVEGQEDRLTFSGTPIAGKAPIDVLPVLRFLVNSAPGASWQIAIRGGLPVSAAWNPNETMDGFRGTLEFVEALVEIQKFTLQRIRIPSIDRDRDPQVRAVIAAARLLKGERVWQEWESFYLPVSELSPDAGRDYAVICPIPLRVTIGGQEIDLGRPVYWHIGACRVADGATIEQRNGVDVMRMVPGAHNRGMLALKASHGETESASVED